MNYPWECEHLRCLPNSVTETPDQYGNTDIKAQCLDCYGFVVGKWLTEDGYQRMSAALEADQMAWLNRQFDKAAAYDRLMEDA